MSNAKKYPHYFKDVSTLDSIDVYRVADLWKITNNAQFHALKKILCAGGRGAKDVKQDIKEAIDALNRWREMLDEDTPKRVEPMKIQIPVTNPCHQQGKYVSWYPYPHNPPPGMQWNPDRLTLHNVGVPDAPRPASIPSIDTLHPDGA